MDSFKRIHSLTHCHLYIHHGVVQPSTDHSDQLMTGVNNFSPWPLVVMLVPLLCAAFHLCCIVGCQGQALEATTSRNQSGSDEVLERERVEGLLRAATQLDGIVDLFCCRVCALWIVSGAASILLVEDGFVLFEALRLGVVNVLGEGDESRRRRNIGGRHFVWRMGRWCKGQWLTLLLSAHDRHALIWSSLPLSWNSSVCRLDKPWIFFTHSVLMSFGVWTIFIFHLTHLCSIFVTLCHPTHPYLLLPHLIFHDSESALFILFLSPPMSIIGYGLCTRPALNMYLYVGLVSAIGIPQT